MLTKRTTSWGCSPSSPPESQDVRNAVIGTSLSPSTSSLPTGASSARNRPQGGGGQLLKQAGALVVEPLDRVGSRYADSSSSMTW